MNVIILLTGITGVLIWIWKLSRPTPQPPPGVTVWHTAGYGWSYVLDDQDLVGTGYLTRKAAIRAAHTKKEHHEHR